MNKYTRMARSLDGVEIMSMKNLVLLKKNMLRYVQYVRAVRGIERVLSDLHVVLCKSRLVGACIKRIKSEKLREHQYIEGYAKYLESKKVECDKGRNVDQM